MNFNDYYKKELTSLRIKGLEFSKRNPGLSSYLSKEGQDPDVERLLEGFAFLSGSLNQLLEQELPEVSHTLMQILWPNYLRVIPSYSILKYDSVKDSSENILVEKSSEVLSKIKANIIQSRFKTIYNNKILPIEISNLEYFSFAQKSKIELDFKVNEAFTLGDIKFENINFFLNGSKFIAYDLYLFLSRYVNNIEIDILNKDKEVIKSINIDKKSIKPIGFKKDEYILDYSDNLFAGYILLQEYFCFRDKFLFMEIENLNKIEQIDKQILDKSRNFRLKIEFNKVFTNNEIPSKENFALYSTPIVNLFSCDAIPIRKSIENDEYLVEPIELSNEYSEVYSIEKARAWSDKTSSYKDFLPFEKFEHTYNDTEYYSVRTKLSNEGERISTYIRFPNITRENLFSNNSLNQTISLKLTCTNKNLPSGLNVGDISIPKFSTSNRITKFKNITIPSISYPPPIKKDFLWRLISNMSLNYLSLSDKNSLKKLIETYDFYGAFDSKQREKTLYNLEGIVSISHTSCEYIDKGFPIRGINIKLVLDKTYFSTLGEAYLFSSVLNEFFSLYVSLNSFHKLSVEILNEEFFEWPVKIGNKEVI